MSDRNKARLIPPNFAGLQVVKRSCARAALDGWCNGPSIWHLSLLRTAFQDKLFSQCVFCFLHSPNFVVFGGEKVTTAATWEEGSDGINEAEWIPIVAISETGTAFGIQIERWSQACLESANETSERDASRATLFSSITVSVFLLLLSVCEIFVVFIEPFQWNKGWDAQFAWNFRKPRKDAITQPSSTQFVDANVGSVFYDNCMLHAEIKLCISAWYSIFRALSASLARNTNQK